MRLNLLSKFIAVLVLTLLLFSLLHDNKVQADQRSNELPSSSIDTLTVSNINSLSTPLIYSLDRISPFFSYYAEDATTADESAGSTADEEPVHTRFHASTTALIVSLCILVLTAFILLLLVYRKERLGLNSIWKVGVTRGTEEEYALTEA